MDQLSENAFESMGRKMEAAENNFIERHRAAREAEVAAEKEALEAEQQARYNRHAAALEEAGKLLGPATAGGVDTLWQAGWEISENPELASVPIWQALSGLTPMMELVMTPGERALRMRKFMAGVERMIRFEMAANYAEFSVKAEARFTAEAQRRGEKKDGEMGGRGDEASDESSTIIDKCATSRLTAWDPLRTICHYLQISQHRLNLYAREVQGMTLTQLVDIIRMERARELLKTELQRVAAEWLAQNGGAAQGSSKETALKIFAALKKTRRAPRWDRTTWAMSVGFSSYAKFFRACLLCEQKTPHDLEVALLEELLNGMISRKDAEAQSTEGTERTDDGKGTNGAGTADVVDTPAAEPTQSVG